MSILDTIESFIPGLAAGQAQIDALRRQFLAIPATTAQNRATLQKIRGQTNDATEVATITQLLAQANAVDAGFQSVSSQFASFDSLQASGGSTVQLAAAGLSLVSSGNNVLQQSSSLANGVAPLAKKYGGAVAGTSGVSGVSTSTMILVGGALVGGFLLLSSRHRGRRQ